MQSFHGLFLYLLVGNVHHKEDEVGIDQGYVDELVHHFVHLVGGVFDDTRGVRKDDLEIVAVDDAEDAMTGGLRLRGDDGDLLSNELIRRAWVEENVDFNKIDSFMKEVK